MLPVHYRVLYDVSTQGFADTWNFPLKGLGFVAVTVIVFTLRNFLFDSRPPVFRRWFPISIMLFAISWTFTVTLDVYFQHQGLVHALRKGSVVEGDVQDFVPMPFEGHANEHFCVKSTCFFYSDFIDTGAFNNTASHGGPVRNGLKMRVTYWRNSILKLEIQD